MKNPISRFLLASAAMATLAASIVWPLQSADAQTPSAPSFATNTLPAFVAPGDQSTPVKPPPNIFPTSPLAQVVRLTQAGVDPSVIMTYITNSSSTFNLDSDKIIYASDAGVPSTMVTAMMQRDQFLQQQFDAAQAAQAAQQGQQGQPLQPEETPPPDEPPPADTAETVAQPDAQPVTVNYFYNSLAPYGSWVVVNGYGRCWRPTVCVYNSSWQPYCDRGRWVYSDCGWYWNSDYAWGATFHYGRWFHDTGYGWCWYPDSVWAPSWVTWRYSNNYCGWAPLPPRTTFQAGVGIVYNGGGVGVGFSFGLGPSCFTFVPTQHFCDPHPRNFCVARAQLTQVYNNTTVINNYNANNHAIVNHGIAADSIAAVTRIPIRPIPVHEINGGYIRGGYGQPAYHPGQIPGVNHPAYNGNSSVPMRMVDTAHNYYSSPGQNWYSSRSRGLNQTWWSRSFHNASCRRLILRPPCIAHRCRLRRKTPIPTGSPYRRNGSQHGQWEPRATQRVITGRISLTPTKPSLLHRKVLRRPIRNRGPNRHKVAIAAETRVARDIDPPNPTLKRRSEIFRPAFLLLQLHRHWQSLGVGISRQQFEQMKARLGSKSPRAILPPVPRHFGAPMRSENGSSPAIQKIILGVDPSLRGTGYGIIKMTRPFPETLAHGTISCPTTWPHSRCLAKISRTLRDVLREYQPTVCAIEGLFFAQNLKTAIIMGEARGAAMAAIAEAGLDIFEIAPRKVKLAIVGYGAAQKSAVAKMVQRLLNLPKPPASDAADALALALAHAQENSRNGLTPLKKI